MKVLSLFGGIEAGRVALDVLGIVPESYHSAEFDQYPAKVASHNYPDIVHIGSVTEVNGHDYEGIDMLIGGPPCQDLSIAGKRAGLEGSRSSLFWEYVRILKESKPKFFLVENVASMPKEAKATMTEALFGIEPVLINSALVSAQNRKRLFWLGQNRKRLYTTDIVCKHCINAKRGIQEETPGTGTEEILGSSRKGHNGVQNMLTGISENTSEMNSKNLQRGVSERKQKTEGQEDERKKSREDIGVHEGISEDGKMETVEGKVQTEGKSKDTFEKCGVETGKKNTEESKGCCKKVYIGNKETSIARGAENDSYTSEKVCCVQCGRELNHGPYHSYKQGMKQRYWKSSDSMSELQFTETRYDDGTILDTYGIDVPQPEDRGIVLKDILEPIPLTDERWKPLDMKYVGKVKERLKAFALTATYENVCPQNHIKCDRTVILGQYRRTDLRVHSDQENSPTLTANMGTRGNNVPVVIGQYQLPHGTNPGGLRDGKKAQSVTANGQYVYNNQIVAEPYCLNPKVDGKQPSLADRIYHDEAKATAVTTCFVTNVVTTKKSHTIKSQYQKNGAANIVHKTMEATLPLGIIQSEEPKYYWRKLTVRECARLQTFPDTYDFSCVSNSRAYKGIGNSWTVEVIAHIFRSMKF